MIQKFFEYAAQSDFEPIKSFYLKDDLNRKVWNDDDSLKEDLRKDLIQIAEDYLDYLEIDVELEDIILTGSLANYNWSEYSDFDVHLIFDFKDVDENVDLVQKYLDAKEKLWKEQHDVTIGGFPIELYCQDIDAGVTATGIYSLTKGEWEKKPKKEDFVPDEDLIRKKAGKIMDSIDDLESDYKSDKPYDELMEKLKKVWKKVKDGRKSGLEREGEFSIENLVFKLLRRNEYITKLLDIKRDAYDKQYK